MNTLDVTRTTFPLVSDSEIERVMAETGMQRMQARNNLIGRKLMLEQLERERSTRAWNLGSIHTQVSSTF